MAGIDGAGALQRRLGILDNHMERTCQCCTPHCAPQLHLPHGKQPAVMDCRKPSTVGGSRRLRHPHALQLTKQQVEDGRVSAETHG